MSTSPAAMPVTIPWATVAIAVSDDSHVASAVTDRLLPSPNEAVAENCAEAPITGAMPVTTTAVALTVMRSLPVAFW